MTVERKCKQRDYCPTPPVNKVFMRQMFFFPPFILCVSTLTKSNSDVFWSVSQQVSGQAGASQTSCCWVTLPALCVWADTCVCVCVFDGKRGEGTPTDANGVQTHHRSSLYSEGGSVWRMCVSTHCGFSRYLPPMHHKIKLKLRYFAPHLVTFCLKEEFQRNLIQLLTFTH